MANPGGSEETFSSSFTQLVQARRRSKSLNELDVLKSINHNADSECIGGRPLPIYPRETNEAEVNGPIPSSPPPAAKNHERSQCKDSDNDPDYPLRDDDEAWLLNILLPDNDSCTDSEDDWPSEHANKNEESTFEASNSASNPWALSQEDFEPPFLTAADLTTNLLPFAYTSALSNHLPTASIPITPTPLFIHSTLQLPATLSHLLHHPTPSITIRLTPAILRQHATTVNTKSLLPSIIPSQNHSSYVQGLLFLPFSSQNMEKVGRWYEDCERQKVDVQILTAEGQRTEIAAWAWVGDQEARDLPEEKWTLEDFVAGRIVGLGAVDW